MTELHHEKISNTGDTALNPGSIKDINVKVDKQKVTDLFIPYVQQKSTSSKNSRTNHFSGFATSVVFRNLSVLIYI